MRKLWRLFLVGVGWFVLCGLTTAGPLKMSTVSVASSTIPVSIIGPGCATQTWSIRVRVTCSSPILIFPYQGPVPGSAPPDVREMTCGESFPDAVTSSLGGANAGIGIGWAAVLETGSTPVTVDSVCR